MNPTHGVKTTSPEKSGSGFSTQRKSANKNKSGVKGPDKKSSQPSVISSDVSSWLKKYHADIEELARWCEEKGLTEQAKITQDWIMPRSDDTLYVSILPENIGEKFWDEKKIPNPSAELKEWGKKFKDIRNNAAIELFMLAKKEVRNGHASRGFDLMMYALRENPDFKAIRKILGFREYQNQWRTNYEVSKMRQGLVWHKQYGWISKLHVKQYESGKRYYKGRWISVEEDARLHSDIRNGWVIESGHYQITTNHSLEAGVKVASQLETFYRVWKQMFLRFYATESQVVALFEGRPGLSTPQGRHKIVIFRSRDEYNSMLSSKMPGIERSLGMYATGPKTVYFFAGKDYDPRTMYHEATHQLFNEMRPAVNNPGAKGNVWVIEGIAMYMETLRDENGYHVVGGFNDQRILSARYRLVKNNFYIPLSEFSAMPLTQFQQHRLVRSFYSEAAGIVHFMIHSENGKYRDDLALIMADVYSGKDNTKTVERITKKSFSELDKEYRAYISRNSAELDRYHFQDP